MDEILVNTSIVGDQQGSTIAGFRGTQFVVVWEDNGDGTIKGQMFGASGNKSSSEFVVNLPGEPNTSRKLPAIVECGLGFAVAWTEKPRGGVAHVKLRTFDQDTLSGPEIQVSTAEVEPLTRPAMARLADGASSSFGRTSGRTSASARNASEPRARRTAPSFAPIPSQGCTGNRWWPAWSTAIS